MLSKLLKSRRIAPARFALPAGRRVYAIGDVHGCIDLLDALLERIEADDRARGQAETTLLFMGDLVDRGPASAAVIDRLLDLRSGGRDLRCIMGNHEEIFLGALAGDDKSLRLFCRIGGRETALSYGLEPAAYERLSYDELAAYLQASVPAAHQAFLVAMEDMIVLGDYLFVHAGIRPERGLEDQRTSDLRWIRDPFLDHRGTLAKLVVHGHTISEQVEVRPHRIGIDTGAYASGRLTALMLEGDETAVLQT